MIGTRTSERSPSMALARSCAGRGLLLLPALALADCTADARPGVITRDSAGIVIVENRGVAAATWRLAPEPLASIGGDVEDTLQALYEVGGALRLEDGRIVLTDGGTRQVRAYSPAGEPLAAVGRDGEGPGEFRSPSRPWRIAGDSLLVYDYSLRRISVLDPALRFARDFRLQQVPGGEPVSPVLVIGGSEILARPGFSFGSATPTGSYRGENGYLRFRLDGTFIDSAGRFPGEEHFVFNEGGSSIALTLPFLPQPRIAATADGFVFGGAATLEIRRCTREGTLLSILRVPDRAAPFTAERKQRFRDDAIAGSPADERPFFERLLAAIPMPDVLPAHTDILVDEPGRLWVRDFAWEDRDSVSWSVFGTDAALVATITMPANFDVQAIGEDWVLGIGRDELGVESVRLHRLLRQD